MASQSSYEYSSQESRKPNFSQEELICLVKEFGVRKQIMCLGSRPDKIACWKDITIEINKVNSQFERSHEEVKKKWNDLVFNTKGTYMKELKKSAGNIEIAKQNLGLIEQMILDLKAGGISQSVHVKFKAEYKTSECSASPSQFNDVDNSLTNAPSISDIKSNNSPNNSNSMQPDSSTSVSVFRISTLDFDLLEFDQWFPESTSKGICFVLQHLRKACGLDRDPTVQKELALLTKKLSKLEEERKEERRERLAEYSVLQKLKKQKLEFQIQALKSGNIK